MASSDPSNPPRTSKTSAPNGAALKSNIKPTQTLHGIWRKDFEQSDMIAMNKALDGMQLSKMQVRWQLTVRCFSLRSTTFSILTPCFDAENGSNERN